MIIRDGINLNQKGKIKNFWQNGRDDPKPMTFKDFCSLLTNINVSGEMFYLRQLRDPYALMLLLGVYERVDLPNVLPSKGQFKKDFLCEDVWKLLKEDNPIKNETLMKRVDAEGQDYLRIIADGKPIGEITVEIVLSELSQVRQFNFNDAYDTWILQPDPEALSFGLLSSATSNDSKTPNQRISAVVGRPCNLIQPTDDRTAIRYPCRVTPKLKDYDRIQIHLSGSSIRVFDRRGELIDLPENCVKFLHDCDVEGVFDAVYNGEDFYVIDVLCINDVWMNSYMANERARYLWYFNERAIPSMIAYKKGDLAKAQFLFDNKGLWIYNLNSSYDPLGRNILVEYGVSTVVQAVVKRAKGRNKIFTLNTSDGVRLFTFGTNRINDENIGKVVDVTKEGVVLKYRFDLKEAMNWKEVADIWETDKPEDLVVNGVWPETIRWRSLKEKK